MAIIYLYDSTVTDFTYNGHPLNKAYEVVVDNMINDSFFVTFNHPLDDKGIYKIIEKDKIVKVHTPDGMQPFRVMDRVKYMDHVSIEAWPLFYADMRNKLVKPLAIRGLSGQAAVNTFVNNLLINTPFTFTSNITDAHDYHTQDTEERENNPKQLYNALDVFKDIVTRWNGELVINGYDIRLLNRLGENTGALLYEKKNISDFTDEESIQDVTTRLYGKSEWTERPEGSDEEIKHEISVKVESPLINAYSGIVFEKQYTNNDIRTEKEMKDWLNLKFTTDNIDKPSRNIKVNTNIVDDTVINLGDSLVLKYVKHDVDMEIRMVGYTYDGYADRYITVQLGDAKQSYVGNVQNTVRELETNVNTSVKQTVNQILNANGERMIYSVNEPVGNFKNGDVWFDQQGGMYFWDEEKGMWIDHPYNRNMNVMAEEVGKAISKAEEAKSLAVSEAESALAQAKADATTKANAIKEQITGEVNTAITTAEDAKALAVSEAENALAQAKADATAKANAIHEQISGEINTAISTAEDAKELAISEAEGALSKAKADATAKANAVKTEVNNSVNTAISTAETAKQTAIDNYANAVAEAERLDGVQKTAFDNRFTTIQNSVDTFNQSVGDVDAKAGDAIEKAGANANLLTTHQNTIDTINTITLPDIASSAGTALANAKDAMDEAKKADGKIADFVKTNGLVSGTTVDSKIDEATGAISKTIRTVEGKIPTEIGGRNYLTGTSNEWVYSNQGQLWWTRLHDRLSISKISGKAGDSFTASVNLRPTGDKSVFIRLTIYNPNSTSLGYRVVTGNEIAPGKEGISTVTIEIDENDTEIAVGVQHRDSDSVTTTFEYKELQLEKGSIPTDWSPAPEDNYTQEEFKIFESTYDEDVKGIKSSLTSLENDKLDGSTYTTFYKNEYEKTAEGLRDAYEKIGKVVDENGNTTDTFAQAVYDQNATRRTDDFTEVTKGLVKEATYTAGINGLSGSISTISGRIDKLTAGGGGRNYALKSNAYYYTNDYKVSEYDLTKMLKGTKIKISVWGGLSTNVRTFRVYINNSLGTASGNSQIIDLTKLDGIHGQGVSAPLSKWTAEATLNVDATKILVFGVDDTSSSPKRIEYVKVETGETFTDWTIAPEDMLGKADFQVFKTSYEANDKLIKARLLAVDSDKEGSIAYRLNETEKTASGNTTTISDIKTKPGEQITGYQTIKERSDLYERVIGKDEAGIKSNMARMVMTDTLFKTEVIKNVPSSIGGRNYVLKSNAYYYTSNYKVAEYDLSTIPKGTKIKISLWGGLGSTVRTFGVYVNNSSGITSGNSQIIELTKLDGVFGQGVAVPLAKWTAEATLNVDAKKILIYGLDNNYSAPKRVEYVQIETGDYYTDWTAAPEDKANMSSITQLENSISLKVSNAELLSAINLQAGGVLIQSGTNKLNITPETTFIKDATIKSAMIDSIDVKQIKGIKADFTSMVTEALTANTITSTMINANDAMFEKLFSNEMATTKLAAQEAWIKSANIVSLDAGKIKTGTIDSGRIDAKAIVTGGLDANVVKSTHIESSTGLIDKIFANEALITRLTSNSIFASKIKAIEIDASKITTGELAAERIKSKDVVTQGLTTNVIKSEHINATVALVNKIFSDEAYIKALTSKSIFASQIKAIEIDASKIKSGTIDSARIDAEYIVTNGLSTNVVESKHIKAETGLVDKIFSKTAYIEELTNKTIFTEKIQAINISADKITSGTLDAGKVKVVNLDANNITSNKTEFITTNWNAVNAFTQIDASGIQMLGSGTWRRTFLSPTGFRMFNGQGAGNKAGAIGYFKSSTDLEGLANPLNEDFMWQTQQRHAIGIGVNKTHLLTLGYQLPGARNSDGYNPALTIDPQKNGQVTINTDARANLGLQVDGTLTLPGGDVFTTYNGLYLNTSYWTIQAKTGVRFFVGGQKKLHIGGNVELGTTLDMAGNAITGQSDYRLKKNIETLNTNDLDKLTGVRMVSYEWIDPERPKGTHVGFTAQELREVYPEFIAENDEGILSINNSELAMAHIHATQELNAKVDEHISNVDNEVAKLKAQIASLQDELALLKGA